MHTSQLHHRSSGICCSSGSERCSPTRAVPIARFSQLQPRLGLRQSRRQLALQRLRPSDSAAGALDSADFAEPEPEPNAAPENVQVFPRLKEKDPYKRLGVPQDASFEEVQDSRNFLVEQYKAHERSRESIELAFDNILQQTYKARNKYGFRPPSLGRKTDLEAEEERLNPWQRFKQMLEPSVPLTTIVNDGSIFLVLAAWAAWMALAADPTLPLGGAMTYCVYKLFSKRKNRSPDGPYWGNSPVWGALGSCILGLVLGGLVSWLLVQFLPLPEVLRPESVGVFSIVMSLGATCLFFK